MDCEPLSVRHTLPAGPRSWGGRGADILVCVGRKKLSSSLVGKVRQTYDDCTAIATHQLLSLADVSSFK